MLSRDRNESVVKLNLAQSSFCWKENEKVISIIVITVVLVPGKSYRRVRTDVSHWLPLLGLLQSPAEKLMPFL